jgi:transcriptional regulator with XRE-family HTH domain
MIKNLRALRNKKGISQQQLAENIGVSQQSINKYENHNIEPDISTLIKLADYFSTSIDYLVGRMEVDQRIEISKKYDLNIDESYLIDGYRILNDKEKDSIRLVVGNYNAKR